MKQYLFTVHFVDGTTQERRAADFMPTICAGTGDLYNDLDLDEPSIPRDRWVKVERNFNVSRGMGYYGAKVFKNPAKPKMAVQK